MITKIWKTVSHFINVKVNQLIIVFTSSNSMTNISLNQKEIVFVIREHIQK